MTPAIQPDAQARPDDGGGARLPSGRVTLLFTDIEGSTRLLQEIGDRYSDVLARYHAIVRRAVEGAGGHVVDTAGDGFFIAFATARQALAAAVAAQHALHAEPWPADARLRVRMGMHTGEPKVSGDRFVGLDVHRAARISAAANGGQVLLSAATWDALDRAALDGVTARDIGAHRLKDLRYPEHLHEIRINGLPDCDSAIHTLSGRPNNLPAPPTAFVGRASQIADVTSLLRRAGTRLVTLTGPGGTGKTRLSLEVGSAVLDEFSSGVYLVALAPVGDAALVPATISQALGIPEVPGKSAIEGLKSGIGANGLLLILDNFEHVVDAAPAIAEVLASCAHLKVLVTSRQPLRIRFEREYPVPPLQLPAGDERRSSRDLLAVSESVQLFVDRVRDVRPDFQMTVENTALLEAICTRLEGLPLAIELAASRMKMLTLTALRDRLHDRLGFLKGGARDLDERHQTLRAAIEWSYNLLDAPHQQLFNRTAVFVGGFFIESAIDVCSFGALDAGEMFNGLLSLSDQSLLNRGEVDGEPRLGMLETIREFALSQIRATPDFEVARARHAAHFVALVEELAPGFMGRDQRRSVGRVLTDLDNVRAALAWALEQPSAEVTSRLVGALLWFWVAQGQMTEGRGWVVRALEQTRTLGATRERAVILNAAAWLHLQSGDYPAGHALSAEAVDVWRALGDAGAGARTKIVLGVTGAALGEVAAGLALLDEALATCRALGDSFGAGLALNVLGEVARAGGNDAQARACYEESIRLLRETGNIVVPSLIVVNLVHSYLHQGDWRAAAGLLAETLSVGLEFNYPFHINYYLAAMGCVAVVRGNHRDGITLLGAFDVLNRSLGAAVQPADQAEFDRYVATAKASLGAAAVDEAWSEGAAWSREQAVAATLALRA